MFACERPNEWESQALLGLTAASWCCSRKSCWTCSCLLAASLCVCVSLPQCARLGVGPVFVLSSSAALTLLSSYSEIRNKVYRQHLVKTHTYTTLTAVVWFYLYYYLLIMWLKKWEMMVCGLPAQYQAVD